MYPTETYFETDNMVGIKFAVAVAVSFGLVTWLVYMYDRLVTRRQRELVESANKTRAIVSSLFPENVQERYVGWSRLDSCLKG